jgi:hypothetical protein
MLEPRKIEPFRPCCQGEHFPAPIHTASAGAFVGHPEPEKFFAVSQEDIILGPTEDAMS